MENPTQYRTIKIDGLSIFYREAGSKDSPTILLLHGLPSSSRMFEPLIRRLSGSLSPRRAGLSRFWPQRVARSEALSLHLRPVRGNHQSLHGSARTLALHALHAGLRWPGWLSHGLDPSRAPRGPDRAGCGVAQRRPRRRTGRRDAPFGLTAQPMKARCARICSLWKRHARVTSAMIHELNAMTPISGLTNLHFSASPIRRIFRLICFTTTEQTSTRTQNGKPGCARRNPDSWCSGENTIFPSTPRNLRPIVETFPTLGFTYLKPVILRSIPPRLKSQGWFATLSPRHVKAALAMHIARRRTPCRCPVANLNSTRGI